MQWIIPNEVIPEQYMAFRALWRTNDLSLFNDFKLGDKRMDRDDVDKYLDFNANSYQNLTAEVSAIEAGFHSPNIRVDDNMGYAAYSWTTNSVTKSGEQFKVKVLAQIESISKNQGSKEGGLEIKIAGKGFPNDKENVKVKIGGADCEVKASDYDEVSCITGKDVTTESAPFEGNSGIQRQVWFTSYTNIEAISEYLSVEGERAPDIEDYLTTTQTNFNYNDYYVQRLYGYFKAPVTGLYRFFINSDDHSRFYLSTDHDPANKVQIFNVSQSRGYRGDIKTNYVYNDDDSRIELQQNQLYYMEIWHKEYGGQDFLSLGVQTPRILGASEQIPNPAPDYQIISVSKSNSIDEQVEIRMAPPGGNGKGLAKYGKEVSEAIDSKIKEGSDPEYRYFECSDLVAAFKELGTGNISCSLQHPDVCVLDGTDDGCELVYTFTYTSEISLDKLETLQRDQLIIQTNEKVYSSVQTQAPSYPIQGTFRIQLNGAAGSEAIDINDCSLKKMKNQLVELLKAQDEDIEDDLITSGWCGLGGLEFRVVFPPNKIFTLGIIDIDMFGGSDIADAPVATAAEKIFDGEDTQFWWVIPNDFLRTIAEKPQIHVYTNPTVKNPEGDPSMCTGDCSFEYVDAATIGEITGITDGATISLTGTNLPTDANKIRITLGGVECTGISASSGTEITFTKPTNVIAGNHQPVVYNTDLGKIPLNASLSTTIDYEVTITDIQPVTGSPQGGTELTITGTNFPPALDPSLYTTFTVDIGGKSCQILTATVTQITCLTIAGTGSSTTITIQSNEAGSVEKTGNSAVFEYNASAEPTIDSVTPNSGSTFVKTDVVISGSGFGDNKDDVIIKLGEKFDCLPKTVTDTQIDCVILGGEPGDYQLSVNVAGKGNSQSTTFTLKFIVSSVNPGQGSLEGGTELLITGEGFSPKLSQNLVQLSLTLENSRPCTVTEVNPEGTQLKCITSHSDNPADDATDDIDYTASALNVVVLGRIQDESSCVGGPCTFQYTDAATPKVTSLSASSGKAGDTLQINGSNFGTNASLVTVTLGIPITPDAVADDKITLTLPAYAKGAVALSVNISDRGNAQIDGSIAFSYNLEATSLSVTEVSQGGTELTITGSGFSEGCEAKFNAMFCVIKSYTADTITCRLDPYSDNENEKALTLNCGSTTASGSLSLRYLAAKTPTITLVENNLDITGTLFSEDSKVYIGGAECPDVSLTGDKLTCGTPQGPSGTQKIEVFVPGFGYATGDFTYDVPYSISSLSINTSSFAGGRDLIIQGSGFDGKATATICGIDCPISQQNNVSITCKVPPLLSKYSIDEFQLQDDRTLITNLTYISSTESGSNIKENVGDIDLDTYFKSDGECYIGIDAGANSKFRFKSVRLLPYISTGEFYKKLVGAEYQVSDDNSTWETIHTIEQPREGWNVFFNPIDVKTGEIVKVYENRYFRLKNSNGCEITEMELYGNIILDSNSSNQICDVVVTNSDGSAAPVQSGAFTYNSSDTLKVTSVSPNFGSIAGGTSLTIGFQSIADGETVSVLIDGVECQTPSISSNTVTCQTGARSEYKPPSFEILVDGKGKVATQGNLYYYAERWSEDQTWGGTVPPREGETVQVPVGMTLVIDQPTPVLGTILVEGTVIVADGDDRYKEAGEANPKDITIDAHFIYVRNGQFRAGTEDAPYQSNLTITLHGQRGDREIPIFGNKVLAVQEGTLDLHGIKRTPTWTSLKETAEAGATKIKLIETCDWQPGEKIVIASTEFDHYEAEEMEIASTAIEGGDQVVNLTSPLQYRHYGATHSYTHTIPGTSSSETIDMEYRAEVGLLTRNIVFQGNYDEQSTKELHGAHIMLFSKGDEESMGRIEYIEVRNAGQSFKLGRYPIHFHMIGTVMNSYITGCSIHHTFQRAITVHAVKYLRIKDNVAYACRGHTYFIEDGVEEYNILEHNLGISTRRIHSLLNSDITPATFWTSAPNNIWINNHAAGSDRYGFWFELPKNPKGPSSTTTVCPEGTKLGEFRGNVSHSNGRYGLRIHPKWIPRERPCDPEFDESLDDPWTFNPSIPAMFYDFTAFKCRRNGLIGEDVGDLRFINFKVADVFMSGLEVTFREWSKPFETTLIQNALLVGKSAAILPDQYIWTGATGIRLPQREGMLIDGANFHNYDQDDMYALGDESHSQDPIIRDFGIRLQHVKRLTYNNVNHKKISWFPPYRGVIKDLDGTLVGTAGAILASYWHHLLTPECTDQRETYDGIVCVGKEIKRLLFHAPKPFDRLDKTPVYVYRKSGEGIEYEDIEVFDEKGKSFDPPQYKTVPVATKIPYITACQRTTPRRSWAFPVVVGYEYGSYFADDKIDWDEVQAEFHTFGWEIPYGQTISGYQDWAILHMEYQDKREHFEVTRGVNSENADPDPTILPMKESPSFDTNSDPAGAHFMIDEPEEGQPKSFTILASGIVQNNKQRGYLKIKAHRCWNEDAEQKNACDEVEEIGEEEEITTFTKQTWSNPATWGGPSSVPAGEDVSQYLPKAGDSIVINPEIEMILDMDTPILEKLEVNGKIIFDPEKSVTLNSKLIFVRRGSIESGSAQYPTNPDITHQIKLHGVKEDQTFAFSSEVEVFNNSLAVTGSLKLFGAPKTPWVRLVGDVHQGDTVIFVEQVDWKVGDQIVIGPSGFELNEHETFTIAAIQGAKPGYIYTGPPDDSDGDSDADIGRMLEDIDFATDPTWQAKSNRKGDGIDPTTKFKVDYQPITSTGITKITLSSAAKYYHIGTKMVVDGTQIETRAEVGVLNRNVKISGIQDGVWNCNVVVSDFLDYVVIGEPPIQRYGQAILDNVEIRECGQEAVERAGMRFDHSSSSADGTFKSSFRNSVVTQSDNFGIFVSESKNLELKNNLIYHTAFGIVVNSSQDVIIDGNVVIAAYKVSDAQNFERHSAFWICTIPEQVCQNLQITNNVASGFDFYGFASQAQTCDQTTSSFSGNIAHSGSYGIIYTNGAIDCQEGHKLTAYHNHVQGIGAAGQFREGRYYDIISVSNEIGFVTAYTRVTEQENSFTKIYKGLFVGPTQYFKCDSTNDGCTETKQCKGQIGIVSSMTHSKPNNITHTKTLRLPYTRPHKDMGYFMRSLFDKITFKNFGKPTVCEGYFTHVGFNSNYDASDLVYPTYFTNSKQIDVEDGYLFYMEDPDPSWAHPEKCLDFPCTGLNNAIITDKDGGLIGGTGGVVLTDYPSIVKQGCVKKEKSNAYICNNTVDTTYNYVVVYVENMEVDANSRFIHPVYVESSSFVNVSEEPYYNKLNAYMDHEWVTFYPSLKHTPRFPAAVELQKQYTWTFTGTRPTNMRVQILSDVKDTDAVIFVFNMQTPEMPEVTVNKTLIKALPYGDGNNNVKFGHVSGTNKWDHINYKLTVLIKGRDTINIKITDQVRLTYRLDMSIDDFFAADGETDFVDRLAASLGIPSYRIRVVDVEAGSVILKTVVIAEASLGTNSLQATELKQVLDLAKDLTAKNAYNFSAPLISMDSEYVGVTDAGAAVQSSEPTEPTQTANPGYNPNASGGENNGSGSGTGGVPGSNGELIGEGHDYEMYFTNWLLAIIIGLLVIVIITSGILSQLGKSVQIEDISPEDEQNSVTKVVVITQKDDYPMSGQFDYEYNKAEVSADLPQNPPVEDDEEQYEINAQA